MNRIHLKDPASAITHIFGSSIALLVSIPLLIHSAIKSDLLHTISLAIFSFGLVLLYTASSLYHSINASDTINRRLKKFDHMSISVLIAGTYTPICLIVLGGRTGWTLFTVIWAMALAGIFLKAFWVYCPKWVSSIIYIIMGWMCVFAFPQLLANLSGAAFGWLLAGGIIYTIGGVIYALKLPVFNSLHKNFNSHDIFHLFCLGGSFCHFILMYYYVATM
ncbi:PAQR family membrane homeostasis protein TrhA [Anaerosporobacter faecicola]|uniref:PAQR family membrane homeostasis protein TrhA n=1 Tax=Anaerosporobacter faecicola TaxID=2718714 RepID=UPI00143C3CA8|nr:hemolysin III family protein [Anaerosporobacter faecicola]